MIIDVHSHTPQWRGAVPDDRRKPNSMWRPDRVMPEVYNWAEYFEAAKGADKSIVFGIAWDPAGMPPPHPGDVPDDVNDATAEFVRAHPDRLLGFLSVHPNDPKALTELERGRTDLGLVGVKLGANYQIFEPLESRALAIYREAERHGLPVLFHMGTSGVRMAPIRYAHPLVIDEIAMRYPDLKIIMAHMGHPWTVDTAVVIRKHPNVYADLSGLFYRPYGFYEAMIKATEWNVLHKLLLGSDFPISTVEEAINGLRNVNAIIAGTAMPRVPEDKIEEIIHRDSLTLLGLA